MPRDRARLLCALAKARGAAPRGRRALPARRASATVHAVPALQSAAGTDSQRAVGEPRPAGRARAARRIHALRRLRPGLLAGHTLRAHEERARRIGLYCSLMPAARTISA